MTNDENECLSLNLIDKKKPNMNDNLMKLNLGFECSKLLRTKLNEGVTKMGGKTNTALYIIL